MAGLDVRPMTDNDRDRAFTLHLEAFGGGPEDFEKLKDLSLEDRWVVTDGPEVIGALRLIRFGHYFGGQRVPAAGIAAVGISPVVRGKGAGGTLMREVLRASADEGMPFSTLFMSTMAPYRSVGYEIAGVRNRYRAPLPTLPRKGAVIVERWGDDEFPEVVACHRRIAQSQNGIIDRPDDWWTKRIFGGIGSNQYLYRYLVRDPEGVVRGYAVYTHEPEPGHFPDNWRPGDEPVIALAMRDFMWETPGAAAALLNLAAGHWSVGTNVYWSGPAADPLLTFFPDRLPVIASSYTWMARLSDVEGALLARGYSPSLDLAVDFAVTDATLPGNAGAYRLEVVAGKPTVERIAAAATVVDVRALAAMYTSSMSPYDAIRTGLMTAPVAADVEALAAAFAGPAPWVVEFF
ncbi:MAG: enhanced intracellular survival protein Eis [Actinomycetes bacterium]